MNPLVLNKLKNYYLNQNLSKKAAVHRYFVGVFAYESMMN